jgi:tetratricopeptide (TPR) repeat protein
VSSLLPFLRNKFFSGREHHLRALEEKLWPSHTHQRMSFYGLGGGGKTALALEFAYRMIAKHSHFFVLWVPAVSRETFESTYRDIGILLRIPGITDDNANVKQLVKDGLDAGGFGDWLMVIDNADDPSVLLSTNGGTRSGQLYNYLPRSNRRSILFTTRGRKAAESLTQSNVLELEDISQFEAKQLMVRRISNKAVLDDESATNELLELLTYLPLAIVQAVAFINNNQVSISSYLSLFKEAGTEIEMFSERFNDPSRYRETESTIARTWQISFDQILKEDQLAADYLSFMACIDRVNIPQSLLPLDGTIIQRMKTIGTLTGYAFISERHRDTLQLDGERLFDVHRLVQKATVWWLKEHDDWTAWTEKVYRRLEELVSYGGHVGKKQWTSYLPHAIHVSDLYSESSETGKASLLDRIGECQSILGHYTAAEATHRRVHSSRREKLGDEDLLTLTSMNKVGVTLIQQGQYEEGETILRQTLALRETLLGKEHPDTLASMNNLAGVLGRQGKYKDAETMDRQTLALSNKLLGKEHPYTLTSMNNLAQVLSYLGKYEEAETMHRKTLAIKEEVLGKEHPDTLESMNNYALILSTRGKYEESEAMHRQTLALADKVFGKEHPRTLTNMNNLAQALSKQGKYKEAEIIQRQTLALTEEVLGKEHPDTLQSMNNLAILLSAQGKYEEAETKLRRTLPLCEKVLGKEHPHALSTRNNLADLLGKQGKYEEAEMMHRQTLAISEEVLGKEHPGTLTTMSNLAGVLGNRGEYEEAETKLKRTLVLREKVLGKEHPDTLGSRNDLASVLSSRGKYEEAEAMLWQTRALREKLLGKEHPGTLTTMNNLAHALSMQNKDEEAETICRQTLELREKVLGKEHPSTVSSVYCLAHLLAKQTHYTEATALYQRACEGYNVVLGDNHPTTRACRENYSDMLRRKDQNELVATSTAPLNEPGNKISASQDGSS